MEKLQSGGAISFSGERWSESVSREKAAADEFYEKLSKLNDSSGLSLLFDFRRTKFDLHSFYDEVIKRGGFYQVTKRGKWEDVASVLNSKSYVSLSAAQLKNIYQMLVFEYELIYGRNQAQKWPPKNSLGSFGCGVTQSSSMAKPKRKHLHEEAKGVETVNWNSTTSISPNSNVGELMVENPKANVGELLVESPKANARQLMVENPAANVRELLVENRKKPRNGYQIFLRLESDRLRKIHGESSTTLNLREMAIDAWRRLSEKDKLPFMEAGKMDRERYKREMAAYEQQLQESKTPITMLNFSAPKEPNDDAYHVSLEDGSEHILSPDESALELGIESMKNAKSNESIFQINWDNNTCT